MKKQKILLSMLLLFTIVLPCFLSIFPINNNIEIDSKQNDMNLRDTSTLKSSEYNRKLLLNYITDEEITSVAISADGNYMIIGLPNNTDGPEIFFFKTSSNSPIWSYEVNNDVYSVAISAKGERAVAGCNDTFPGIKCLFVFNKSADGGTPEWIYNQDCDVLSVSISADGNYIAMGGKYTGENGDGHVALLNCSERQRVWGRNLEGQVNSVDISADGNYTVVGTQYVSGSFWPQNTVFLFNKSAGGVSMPKWYYNTSANVNSVSISANGSYCVAAGDEQVVGDNIFVFNKSAVGVKQPEWSYDAPSIYFNSIAISKNNSEYIAAGGLDASDGGKFYFFNRSEYDGKPIYSKGVSSTVYSVAISDDGNYTVVGTKQNAGVIDHLYLFNKSTVGGEPEWSYEMDHYFGSVSISSKGDYFVAGGTYTAGSGRAVLFGVPFPSSALPPGGGDDDDDDDDDTGVIVVVVVIIILASVGGVFVVIIVLIKKGIIDLSKLKR